MRPPFRATKSIPRRVLPERSRLTVPRTVAALRRSREALVGLESELDHLLIRVRGAVASFDPAASERLARAKHAAVSAMADLGDAGALFA
jgi:hypothetical protein